MIRKIIWLVWKELLLVKSQKLALALIIIYPLLTMGVLGIVFSGELSKGIRVGIFDTTKGNTYLLAEGGSDISAGIDFEKTIAKFQNMNVIPAESGEELESMVKSGKSAMGLIISRNGVSEKFLGELLYVHSYLARAIIQV